MWTDHIHPSVRPSISLSFSLSLSLSLSLSVGADLKRTGLEIGGRTDLTNLIGVFFVTYVNKPKDLTFLHFM